MPAPWSDISPARFRGSRRLVPIPRARSFTIVPVFVDTNVLVYARDRADPAKHARAAEWLDSLWRSGHGRVSFQVLHEFYVTTTRKLVPGMKAQEARADVEDLLAWQPVPVDGPALRLAW